MTVTNTILLPYQRIIGRLCRIAVNQVNPPRKRWKALRAILKIIGIAFGIKFGAFQERRIWRFISDLPHFFEVSCRGGSKTQDFLIGAFILCEGEYTQCIWLAGNNKQLEEAIKKAGPLLLLFSKASWGTSTKSHDPVINFINGSQIEFNPCTATSGGRKNLIVLDEGGKITEKDKKEAYRFAIGMKEGTFIDLSEDAVVLRLQGQIMQGNASARRIRHCSTLAYDTPAEEFYKILEPLGLVFITTVEDVWWVRDSYQNDPVVQAMPEWWVMMEYWCKLMPRGTKILKKDPVIVNDFNITEMMREYHDGKILIGADWNPAWGHAFVAVFYRAGKYVAFDELRTQPPANPGQAIMFLKRYLSAFPGRVYLRFENPNSIINLTREIEEAGITINEYETWDSKTQALKVTTYQGLVEHDNICYAGCCTITISQHERYAFDENGKIPRQEDHMLDCISHVIEELTSGFTVDAPTSTYTSI